MNWIIKPKIILLCLIVVLCLVLGWRQIENDKAEAQKKLDSKTFFLYRYEESSGNYSYSDEKRLTNKSADMWYSLIAKEDGWVKSGEQLKGDFIETLTLSKGKINRNSQQFSPFKVYKDGQMIYLYSDKYIKNKEVPMVYTMTWNKYQDLQN